jgi:hypothetical protein
MTRRSRYPQEVRERAVRMVFEHQEEHPSQWAAITSIAMKFGVSSETLRHRRVGTHISREGKVELVVMEQAGIGLGHGHRSRTGTDPARRGRRCTYIQAAEVLLIFRGVRSRQGTTAYAGVRRCHQPTSMGADTRIGS